VRSSRKKDFGRWKQTLACRDSGPSSGDAAHAHPNQHQHDDRKEDQPRVRHVADDAAELDVGGEPAEVEDEGNPAQCAIAFAAGADQVDRAQQKDKQRGAEGPEQLVRLCGVGLERAEGVPDSA